MTRKEFTCSHGIRWRWVLQARGSRISELGGGPVQELILASGPCQDPRMYYPSAYLSGSLDGTVSNIAIELFEYWSEYD